MACVVNVNITGSDELSATMTRSAEAVQRFGQTVNAQTAPLQRYEQGAIKARAALGPLSSGVQELTGAICAHRVQPRPPLLVRLIISVCP